MTGTVKCLVFLWALACVTATADDLPRTASVLGVQVELDDRGQPAKMDEATRQRLIENLRASFAARGVDAHTGPLKISASGVESTQIGLDRTAISVARINADGALEMQCVQGEEKAAEFLAGAADQ